MEQIIYADILWVVNFSMDFLALYITTFILKIKFSSKRCALAAAVGALYCILAITADMGNLLSLFSTAAIGVLMCIISSGFYGIKLLFKQGSIFLAINLLIGGGMTAIYEYFNSHGGADNILIYGNAEKVEQQLPMFLFASACIIVSVVVIIFGRSISKFGSTERVDLHIEHRGRMLSVIAFRDSGNLLTEPISGLPIILLTSSTVKRLLDNETYRLLTEMSIGEEERLNEKIRFVVYETVSGSGILGAFRPERITVNGVNVDGWIAISDKLKDKTDSISEAIVPSCLVN